MSRAVKSKSQEYRSFTVEKRGKDRDVRVPQFPKTLKGDALKRAAGKIAYTAVSENRDKAVALLESWLRADYQLLTRMYDINLLARECVDDFWRTTRSPMKAAATQPTAARMEGIRQAAIANLMEYKLRRDKRMGDATRPLLMEETKDHRAKGTTMLQHAAWCEMIAKALPDDKTKVRAVLKEADLDRFLKAAQKVAA